MMMILKLTNECGVEKLICTFVKLVKMMMIIDDDHIHDVEPDDGLSLHCLILIYICLKADSAALLPLV